MEVGPPDFVGVGTYLAGTEWWMRTLCRHPDVAGPAGRSASLGFFAPFCARPMQDADVAAYHARFPRRPGQLVGEWSNRYLYDAWTAPLLARAAPDAKLLMVLRDPVAIYAWSLGYRRAKGSAAMAEEVHRGRFGSQLRALTRCFDPGRVLVLQFEALLRDPVGEHRRTLRFLGVRDDVVPRALQRPADRLMRPLGLPPWLHARPLRRRLGRPVPEEAELWPDLRASLVAELEPEVADLLGQRPDLDVSLWPAFAHLA